MVDGFDHHRHALWLEHPVNGLGDLRGHGFLRLEAAGEHLDHAGELAEAHDTSTRDVGDVHLAEEGQQVVLAQAVHLDVLYQHHVAVALGEERIPHGLRAGERVARLVAQLERSMRVYQSNRPVNDGSKVKGYVYDRRLEGDAPHVRVMTAEGERRRVARAAPR